MLKIELKYIFYNPQVISISLNTNFHTFTKAECNIINIKAPLSNTFKLRLHQNISYNVEVVLGTVDLLMYNLHTHEDKTKQSDYQ